MLVLRLLLLWLLTPMSLTAMAYDQGCQQCDQYHTSSNPSHCNMRSRQLGLMKGRGTERQLMLPSSLLHSEPTLTHLSPLAQDLSSLWSHPPQQVRDWVHLQWGCPCL
jgi:hypothetical protein